MTEPPRCEIVTSEAAMALTTHPSGRPSVVDEAVTRYSMQDGRLIELMLPSHQLRRPTAGPEAAMATTAPASTLAASV